MRLFLEEFEGFSPPKPFLSGGSLPEKIQKIFEQFDSSFHPLDREELFLINGGSNSTGLSSNANVSSAGYGGGSSGYTTGGSATSSAPTYSSGSNFSSGSTTSPMDTNQQIINTVLTQGINANLGQVYKPGINDCDIWVKTVLDSQNLKIAGLTNPANMKTADEKAIIAAQAGAFYDSTAMKPTEWYVGCNGGHMYFVQRAYNGNYIVADNSSDHKAINSSAGGSQQNVYSQVDFLRIYGNNGGGSVFEQVTNK